MKTPTSLGFLFKDFNMKMSDIPEAWFENQKMIYGLKPICHLDYWDGPLSALCVDDVGEYWYVECPYLDTREIWCAWKLTPEQTTYELEKHNAFCKYVGTHTNYDTEGQRLNPTLAEQPPRENWDKYFKDPKWSDINQPQYHDRDFDGVCVNPTWK